MKLIPLPELIFFRLTVSIFDIEREDNQPASNAASRNGWSFTHSEVVLTLFQIVKRSVAESVPDRASSHNRSAALQAVSVMEQNCSAPLLKLERSVSDRLLKLSESSLNIFIKAEIATDRIGK